MRVALAHLEDDMVLLADLDDIRVSHERMEVDLVDDGQFRAVVQKLLDMFGAPVRYLQCSAPVCHDTPQGTHSDRLDQALLLGIDQSPPDVLPDLRPADRRVHEVEVKVLDLGPFERFA